jgi:hypothetical protein
MFTSILLKDIFVIIALFANLGVFKTCGYYAGRRGQAAPPSLGSEPARRKTCYVPTEDLGDTVGFK